MMYQHFRTEALWTHRYIVYQASSEVYHDKIDLSIKAFESRYSRFFSWSLISQLNCKKKIQVDDELIELMMIWCEAYKKTEGVFSPFLWSILSNLWYDAEYSFVQKGYFKNETAIWDEISMVWNEILLWSTTTFDVWWYGKWFLIDKIASYFIDQWVSNWIIDGWWDIRFQQDDLSIFGPIWIPHPTQNDMLIAEYASLSWAIATSSAHVRKRWVKWEFHHLIDPETWVPSEGDILSVTVFSELACAADIWATALYIWWKNLFDELSDTLSVWYIAMLWDSQAVYTDVLWLTVYATS